MAGKLRYFKEKDGRFWARMRFIARKRVGADVTHPDRFVKLQVAA